MVCLLEQNKFVRVTYVLPIGVEFRILLQQFYVDIVQLHALRNVEVAQCKTSGAFPLCLISESLR